MTQIDTADKQLKATRQFLEEQAAEREQERDEFQREIELLKSQLRDMEKERSSFANASEEVSSSIHWPMDFPCVLGFGYFCYSDFGFHVSFRYIFGFVFLLLLDF